VLHPDAYTLQFGGGEPADLRQRLAALKGAVPPQRRRWDAATRTWWIDPVVERLFRTLSHWTDRWFAPDQVQREHAAGPAGPAWACQRDTGDAAAVGWVEPPPAAPPGRAGPARPNR
jgi:hypothetical protein